MPPGDSRKTNSDDRQRPYARPTSFLDPRKAQQQATQDATAGIIRGQIESIFQQGTGQQAEQTQAAQQPESNISRDKEQAAAQAAAFAETSHTSPDSPYDRTHQPGRTTLREGQWKQYHTAWQDYYQQYYERYYIGEVYRMRQTLDVHTTPSTSPKAHEHLSEEQSESDAAFHALRANLLQNVRGSAVKVRRSQHFMPLLAAALTMVLFLFLQYNRILFANVEAYVSPGNINPANIIVDPNVDIVISNEPRLIIPKINVDVPVVYDTKPDQVSQLQAMEKGVAWFGIPGANSRPGYVGNTVLSGHSSNDLFDPGNYKFIFARLEQLVEGDTFYINYLGVRHVYTITKKEVVKPTDVQKLVYPTDKPIVTLITCVPLGTAQNRLLVTAEQISPSPIQAEDVPESTDAVKESAMPGNTPSFLGRLFGS